MASMKKAGTLILAFTMGVALTLQAIAETQPDTARYGSHPANYKEIVTQWLNKQLLDPDSARIEWNGEPKPADLGKNGEHLYGIWSISPSTPGIASAVTRAIKNMLFSSVMAK